MKLLVFELNSFHLELLPMYQPLMPSLFGAGPLDLHYFVLPGLVERARAVVGARVHALNSPRLRYVLPSKRLRSLYYRWRIQGIVDRMAPVALVFNTVEPAPYLRVFQQIRHPLKIGIVHNPRREGIDYDPRRAGELIFCLHDYNYRILQQDKPVDGYLSPVFKYCEPPQDAGAAGPLTIAVQGVISFSRRDYPMLITLCRSLARQPRPPDIVFNVLGDADIRDGPKLKAMIGEYGLERFITVHSWLPDEEFFRQLQQADYITCR